MEKIYSKFVKERKKEFQIETAIWNNENGKFITKRNLHKEGRTNRYCVRHLWMGM